MYEIFKGKHYRICYGLKENGSMNYNEETYEFSTFCNCPSCANRKSWQSGLRNQIVFITKDKNNFDKIINMINTTTCGLTKYSSISKYIKV